jgi:monooxygenase
MEQVDVLIVGAGLSGIGAAVHLRRALPRCRVLILEGRERIGGTWDVFRYPGVRSDSTMYTLGYSFKPWQGASPFASGEQILAYLEETVREHSLAEVLRLGQRVKSASWSSREALWRVQVEARSGERTEIASRLLFMCTGYYDLARGYAPQFPGQGAFQGAIVHPQHWDPETALDGKRVIVIGSGATAMSLVPALAERAEHVTLLQRSPSYVVALPRHTPWGLRGADGDGLAWFRRLRRWLLRWQDIVLQTLFYALCLRFPGAVRRLLLQSVRRALGGAATDAHFSPRYAPWDQRLCVLPGGDLFTALQRGTVSMVTEHVARFVPNGVELRSGEVLPADLVVTATGLVLKLLDGVELTVDGERVDPTRALTYRGMMFSGIPNLVCCLGYVNNSWTLRSELVARYVCRLLKHMRARGYRVCTPQLREEPALRRPLMSLGSGYAKRGAEHFAQQGTRPPWVALQNHLLERWLFAWASFDEPELVFEAATEPGAVLGVPTSG